MVSALTWYFLPPKDESRLKATAMDVKPVNQKEYSKRLIMNIRKTAAQLAWAARRPDPNTLKHRFQLASTHLMPDPYGTSPTMLCSSLYQLGCLPCFGSMAECCHWVNEKVLRWLKWQRKQHSTLRLVVVPSIEVPFYLGRCEHTYVNVWFPPNSGKASDGFHFREGGLGPQVYPFPELQQRCLCYHNPGPPFFLCIQSLSSCHRYQAVVNAWNDNMVELLIKDVSLLSEEYPSFGV